MYSNKPLFARQFSVQSHSGKHAFEVTDYGPESAAKPLKSVITNIPLEPLQHVIPPEALHNLAEEESSLTEEESTDDLVRDDSQDCIVDMTSFDNTDISGSKVSMKVVRIKRDDPMPLDALDTCHTVIKPQTKHQIDIFNVAKRGRMFAKRKKDRLVEKNGECKVAYTKVRDRGTRFLSDFFTTMLELKWRYHFLVFILVFALSWIIFGLLWWAIASYDIHHNWDADEGTLKQGHEPCVAGVLDYPSALLFSIETQHTIGYGTRAITTSCPFAMFLMMLQSMYGVIIQCILTGIIFAKMARPKRRAQTIIFSNKAVVCERDGERHLMFRVGDIRRSQILSTAVHMMLAERRMTKEGETLPIATKDISVTTECGSDFFFLAWPIAVVHKIDSNSPLWALSEERLLQKDWELIVVMEGVAEVTGSTFQVRTSYLPSEVLWGHRLKSLVNKKSVGIHEIDYTHFHETETVEMTQISAKKASSRQMRLSESEKLPDQTKHQVQITNNNKLFEIDRVQVGNGDCA